MKRIAIILLQLLVTVAGIWEEKACRIFPLANSGRVGAEFARILFSTRGLPANLLAFSL